MALKWQDRTEIIELGARLNYASDKRDAETWLELFDAEGRLEVNGNTLCQGHDEIAAYIERARTQTTKRRHWVSNMIIDEVRRMVKPGSEAMSRFTILPTASPERLTCLANMMMLWSNRRAAGASRPGA